LSSTTIERECKKHGMTKHRLRVVARCAPRHRCLKCACEAVIRRRRKVKLKAVEYKGGKCEKCGYDKSIRALEFHHRDPHEKDFHLAKGGHSRSWDRVKIELDKCDLLCANCHAETHDELDQG